MSDDLVKRLQDPPFGTETSERNLMAKAAAALVAKDAEIARLRGLLDSAASALYDADLSHTDHCGTMFNYQCTCGLDELRAALNTQPKGETP